MLCTFFRKNFTDVAIRTFPSAFFRYWIVPERDYLTTFDLVWLAETPNSMWAGLPF
jgi:hypothetical protein